jgi:hypothetical protein
VYHIHPANYAKLAYFSWDFYMLFRMILGAHAAASDSLRTGLAGVQPADRRAKHRP